MRAFARFSWPRSARLMLQRIRLWKLRSKKANALARATAATVGGGLLSRPGSAQSASTFTLSRPNSALAEKMELG
jgi:hypothetical protein